MQMGEAASRFGLRIQYCMALPRHVLQSVEIPSVTQVGINRVVQFYKVHVCGVVVLWLGLDLLWGLLMCGDGRDEVRVGFFG